MSQTDQSPSWNLATKVFVVLITLLFAGLIAVRFTGLIGQVVTAAMIAYLLHPVITWIDVQTPLSRSAIVLLVYFAVLILLLAGSVALGVAAYSQIVTFINSLPTLISNLFTTLEELSTRTIAFGPFRYDLSQLVSTVDLGALGDQFLSLIQPTISRGGQLLGRLATRTIGFFGVIFFVFVISIYLANEIPKLGGYVGSAANFPGYREDAERLMREFGRIWSAYLRGQIVLGLVIGFVVSLSLGILGVQNAVALGILSGLLEFVPVLGPLIGTGVAIVVAFFQPSNYLGLEAWQFALVVLGVMIVIQQLENNILVPRIVGEALDLHPLLVIIGVFMGGSLAGIVGAILAAPVLATIKLLGIYAWRKLFDLPPFVDPEPEPSPSYLITLRGRGRSLWQRLREWRRPAPGQDEA